MFEWPVKEFFRIVKGDSSFASIVFHLVVGSVCGLLLFAIFNINGQICTTCGIPIRIDYTRFFALETQLSNRGASDAVFFKTIEFVLFVVMAISLTATAHYIIRRNSLKDALTPIREKLVGDWTLKLTGFSIDGAVLKDFTCNMKFRQTEARKLRAFYEAPVESSIIGIKGNTSMIAMAVSGDNAQSSQIELSLPIISRVHLDNRPFLVTYWVSLTHTPENKAQKMQFSGDWYKCMGPEQDFLHSGTAFLHYVGKPKKEAAS